MDLIDVENEDEREAFLQYLQESVNGKQYPYCDPSLVYDVIRGWFIVDDARDAGFDKYGDTVDELVSGVVSEFDDYAGAGRSDGELTTQDRAATMCVHVWYDTMGELHDVDGETVKVGDLVNRSIHVSDCETVVEYFETVEEVVRDGFFGTPVNGSVGADSPYKDVLDEVECGLEDLIAYHVLMMSFHRVFNGNRLSEGTMRAP